MLASVSATMHCRGVQSGGWGWRTACQVGPRPREATKETCISRPPSPVGCHLADGPAGRNGRDAWPLCGPSAPACRPIAPRCPLRAWIGPPSPLSRPSPSPGGSVRLPAGLTDIRAAVFRRWHWRIPSGPWARRKHRYPTPSGRSHPREKDGNPKARERRGADCTTCPRRSVPCPVAGSLPRLPPRAGLGRSTDRRHKTSRDETCARRSREESWRDKIRDRWAGVVVAHPPGPWGETTKSGRHGLAISVPRDLRPVWCGPAISERIHTIMKSSLACLGSRPASLHVDGRRVSLASPLGEAGRVCRVGRRHEELKAAEYAGETSSIGVRCSSFPTRDTFALPWWGLP